MWQIARSISDAFGVGFLAAQLVKLIGVALALFGPVEWITGIFKAAFPFIAKFFTINLGLDLNGLDIMAVSIALSGTLILASSVTTKEAMSTIYVYRFFMIPYALIIILIAILVQIATPIVELFQFQSACSSGDNIPRFYGSSCSELSIDELFSNGGSGPSSSDEASAMSSGVGFILSTIYLVVVLPFIAVLIFFFKRLSVNRLLRRVAIAVGAAIALVLLSTGYAVIIGDTTFAEIGEQWFG